MGVQSIRARVLRCGGIQNIQTIYGDGYMTTAETVIAIVMFTIAGILILLGILSFFQRGFILNNAYIYASKEDRKTMNKKPYYRQTAIVFCLLSIVFIIIGISVILRNYMIDYLQIPVIICVIIYVAVSSIKIGKEENK